MPLEGSRPDAIDMCLVCGFSEDGYQPWGADGTTPTYDDCPCGRVELGYQDATVEASKRFRQCWLDGGSAWAEPHVRPEVRRVEEPLAQLPDRVR